MQTTIDPSPNAGYTLDDLAKVVLCQQRTIDALVETVTVIARKLEGDIQ